MKVEKHLAISYLRIMIVTRQTIDLMTSNSNCGFKLNTLIIVVVVVNWTQTTTR